MHDGADGGQNKDVYAYITTKRMESLLTWSNRSKVMQKRHVLYKSMYDFELDIHGGDERDALICIRQTLGTGQESYALIDYKNPPTWKTKLACAFTAIKKAMFHKMLGPFIYSVLLYPRHCQGLRTSHIYL